jgi:uncharacterized membrane protein YhaH (DUF805 family)
MSFGWWMSPNGVLDRNRYSLVGFGAFAVKYLVDNFVARFFFDKAWPLQNYFILPVRPLTKASPSPDLFFYGVMLLVALPFIWLGVCVTVKRLRDARLPPVLAGLFFLPFVNVLFLVGLCFVYSGADQTEEDWKEERLGKWLPMFRDRPAALSLTVVVLVAFVSSWVAFRSKTYGWALFVGMPFGLGLASSLLYGAASPKSLFQCVKIGLLTMTVYILGLIALAFEGLICVAMVLPFAIALTVLGSSVGYVIQRRALPNAVTPGLLILALAGTPVLVGFDWAAHRPVPQFCATSSIRIAAPIERVWDHVVSFAELDEPTEWLFKAGVAYPKHAVIEGQGVGAIRHCVFSTGKFVEPIIVWDQPHHLKFTVTETPPPMDELSPYRNLRPPHLEGLMKSEMGEFRLETQADGSTVVHGTTWYRHGMWPAFYWRLWADAIIHRIHLRVLRHIKTLAENSMISTTKPGS